MEDNGKRIYKKGLFVPILLDIFLATVVSSVAFGMTKNFLVWGGVFWLVLVLAVFIVFLLQKTYIYDEEGIEIRSRKNIKKIKWKEIDLAYTGMNDFSPPTYSVVYNGQKIVIPEEMYPPDFEEILIDWAGLKIEMESSIFDELKRWKRPGYEYNFDNFFDKIDTFFYYPNYLPSHSKWVKVWTILWILWVGFIIAIAWINEN